MSWQHWPPPASITSPPSFADPLQSYGQAPQASDPRALHFRSPPPTQQPLFDQHETDFFGSFLDNFVVNPEFTFTLPPGAPQMAFSPPPPAEEALGIAPDQLSASRASDMSSRAASPRSPPTSFETHGYDSPAKRIKLEPIDETVPPPPAPVASSSATRPRRRGAAAVKDEDAEEWSPSGGSTTSAKPTRGASGGRRDSKSNLTDGQKRSNHIVSEQRRRDAIREDFKELVSLLKAAEPCSELVLAGDGKGKANGRGRGRRSDGGGTNASKSVVLNQGARYIGWLDQGNQALENEIARIEALAGL